MSLEIKYIDAIPGSRKRGIHQFEDVPDDDSIALPDATAGFGWVMAGDNEVWMMFAWKKDGTPSIIMASDLSDVDTSDTDGDLCLIKSGTQVSIKNRLGGAKDIQMIISCMR